MKSRKIKTEISEKLKNVCEELSEKERKGVLVGMLAISTVLCAITVTRAFGRFLSHGTQKGIFLSFRNRYFKGSNFLRDLFWGLEKQRMNAQRIAELQFAGCALHGLKVARVRGAD